MISSTLAVPSTHTAAPLLEEPLPLSLDQAVIAAYSRHSDAETAIRLLAKEGLLISTLFILVRNFQSREDVQGFYRPVDAVQAHKPGHGLVACSACCSGRVSASFL